MTVDRNAFEQGLADEVRIRIAAYLAEIPEQQKAYALEIVTCQLDLLDAILGAGLTGRHRATVRMLGHEWAARRWPLDPLLAILGKVAEEVAEVLLRRRPGSAVAEVLATVADVSHQCLAELSNGFQEIHKPRRYRADTERAALALLRGQEVPAEWQRKPVHAYGVLAFRVTDDSNGFESATAWLAEQAGDGTLSLVCDQGGYVLVPAHDITSADAFARQLHTLLPEETWTGVSWRLTDEIPAGRAEATEVVTSALASRRPPGCYELGDVLVEYAVLRQPTVRELLIELIEPVVHIAPLVKTLNALLAANGNRTKAAAELAIHRSTLDYRLGQIERLTGHAPSSSRALQVLNAALIAHAASSCALPDVSTWDLS
jgi:hypothetical protein